MLTVKPKYLFIGSLVAHSLLIPTGIIVMLLGMALSQMVDITTDPGETVRNEIFELSMIVGVMNVVIGICGLCATLIKLETKVPHIATGCLLALSLIINVIFMIICLTIKIGSDSSKTVIEQKGRLLRTHYGVVSEADGLHFTNKINYFQEKHACCGWTGLDGENVFLNTPWSKLVNVNATKNPMTLPESCCIKPDDLECQTTPNVKEARAKGLVYKKDCVEMAATRVVSPHVGYIVQIVISMVMQIPSAAVTALFLLPDQGATMTVG